MPTPKIILEFKDVYAAHEDGKEVLRGLNFQMFEGEILGLIGASGSGKSSLARLIIGDLQLSSGKVYFDGEELMAAAAGRSGRREKRIAMVFQDPNSALHPYKSIERQLKDVLTVSGQVELLRDRSAFVQLQRELGLDPELSKRYPIALSGGQKQRAAIACALLSRPQLLIADEAVSALDLSVQAQILNYFRFLHESRDFSTLFISHDLDVMAYLCDRIMVLEEGQIVEIAKTEELIRDPKSAVARDLLASAEVFQNEMRL
ncbi:MAG: dipeptide/oligopeptide/nickel ABC transporter ATP-binding protein [Eubacteriales bacterium]|nr:dipeptide/oligopeptide/nickel ABC transporter ATP-binding protein [Eubacteriales bacterium]